MGAIESSSSPNHERVPAAFQTLYTPGSRVEVASTPLHGGIPGVARAFHTSVVVDEREYSFSNTGITCAKVCSNSKTIPSHNGYAYGPPVVSYMGLTSITGAEMHDALRDHFRAGTYDLLRKNCNSFTDSALFYLLDLRLDPSFRGLEQIGAAADRNAGIVQAISGGEYAPNAKADNFDLERTIKAINKTKGCSGSGREKKRDVVSCF
mmetsp:Transcript_19708/g.35683  ORF Transcript_19708/g.35683 Transcript_19708/m.35683 type:complete len:208 (-) Transcript_19708:128-751(-)